jgi:DNA polymerase
MPEINWHKLEQIEYEAQSLQSIFPALSKNYVPGEGDNAEAFIIGEAPGAQEDIERRPFVGKCKVLRDLMALADLYVEGFTTNVSSGLAADRQRITVAPNCWLTNVVKYKTPRNRNPTNAEVRAFRRLLQDEWVAVGSPDTIITVGGIALSAVFGKSMSVLRHAGRCHTMRSGYTGKKLYIWPMLHPAFGLRGDDNLKEFIEQDWLKLGAWRAAHS